MTRIAAVFFDVDFTLIRPGPRFLGDGYAETCLRYGVTVDAATFEAAVAGAAGVLESDDRAYHDAVFVRYTARIIELMGGAGPGVECAAREIYDAWAAHQHFEAYDDVAETVAALVARGVRLGLISNSHRPLDSFVEHFLTTGVVAVAVSSAEFGVMKPDRRIFEEALRRMRVTAAEALMVGDSLAHDVLGAREAGLRAVWLNRHGQAAPADASIPVIRSLTELPALL